MSKVLIVAKVLQVVGLAMLAIMCEVSPTPLNLMLTSLLATMVTIDNLLS